MPTNVKQTRALLRGNGYHRKFVENLSTRLRPIAALLKQGAEFLFTPAMEAMIRQVLHELDTSPILVIPDWDAGTTPALSACTVTPAAMVLAPPSSRTTRRLRPPHPLYQSHHPELRTFLEAP